MMVSKPGPESARARGNTVKTVMVVEDDEAVRRVLVLAFARANFHVLEAALGAEALAILDSRPVDAVVLDYGLPDRLGPAVLDRLRSSEGPGDASPMWLLISAMDAADVAARCGPLGTRFVPKPFEPRKIVDMIQRAMA